MTPGEPLHPASQDSIAAAEHEQEGQRSSTPLPEVLELPALLQSEASGLKSGAELPALLQSEGATASGLKSGTELAGFWSPSLVLGEATPTELSRQPSRVSTASWSINTSSLHSPSANSSVASSALHTPALPNHPLKNYSPTASLDSESLHSRRTLSRTPSAATPALFEESSSSHLGSTAQHSSSAGPPSKLLESSSPEPLSQSIKVKLERFAGLFSRKRAGPSRTSKEAATLSGGVAPGNATNHHSRTEMGQECCSLVSSSDSTRSASPMVDHAPSQLEESPESSEQPTDSLSSLQTLTASPHFSAGFPGPPAPPGRRFSLASAALSQVEAGSSRLHSSSLPGLSQASGHVGGRTRSAQSESDTTRTVLHVQQRLQELVQNSSLPEHSSMGEREEEEEGEVEAVGLSHETAVAMDSSGTVQVTSSPPTTSGGGGRLHVGSLRPHKPCPGSEFHGSGGQEAGSSGHGLLSPVSILDHFVAHGEQLHCSAATDAPLTEQEGVVWEWFGGCPHAESHRLALSQVGLLQMQLLFERHQCLQHSRRNRQLLSQARDAQRLAEEHCVLVRRCCVC